MYKSVISLVALQRLHDEVRKQRRQKKKAVIDGAERDCLEDNIRRELLDWYAKVSLVHEDAVVPHDSGFCPACAAKINHVDLGLMRLQAQVMECSSCGRILYDEEAITKATQVTTH